MSDAVALPEASQFRGGIRLAGLVEQRLRVVKGVEMGDQQRPRARVAGERSAEGGGEVRLFLRPVRARKSGVGQQQVAACLLYTSRCV